MGTAVLDGRLEAPAATRVNVIDFLYLDAVRKMFVTSAERARTFGFVSSPTIRVNGQDIALELRESNCDECGEACGCGGAIDCRLWVWQGREYAEAPTAMIVDAILREVYGGAERADAAAPAAALPENLERYFEGQAQVIAESASCCSPARQASCCEPSEKASCCGEASSGSCGCQS